MKALTCFQRPDCEAFSILCEKFKAQDSHLWKPSRSFMSAFSMLLTLGGAVLEQGRTGSPHHPQDGHCLPKKHWGQRKLEGGFQPDRTMLVHSASATSSKSWGLALPLLSLLSHSHSSLTSLEKIYHVYLWFSSGPHQLYEGGWQVAACPFYKVRKLTLGQ